MLGLVLYGWLIIVGGVALVQVALAALRAPTAQTAGRLIATLGVLAGLILASSGRLTEPAKLPALVVTGLVLVDVGLTLYTLYLPDNGLLQLISRRRRRESGGAR